MMVKYSNGSKITKTKKNKLKINLDKTKFMLNNMKRHLILTNQQNLKDSINNDIKNLETILNKIHSYCF
jgi:hypothetical protein